MTASELQEIMWRHLTALHEELEAKRPVVVAIKTTITVVVTGDRPIIFSVSA